MATNKIKQNTSRALSSYLSHWFIFESLIVTNSKINILVLDVPLKQHKWHKIFKESWSSQEINLWLAYHLMATSNLEGTRQESTVVSALIVTWRVLLLSLTMCIGSRVNFICTITIFYSGLVELGLT